ncbi:phospholipase A [Marinomonas balearica]|uniref:Phospholipase A1 n=1 Tax=Marinomonas balearica TaxID=491947 RepID=A0A4R6ME11_9GAMM|nr:phospholipase A [Marinomonas balearica]TDO99455.1 phospholipase A1 [Marinomonas balearica]
MRSFSTYIRSMGPLTLALSFGCTVNTSLAETEHIVDASFKETTEVDVQGSEEGALGIPLPREPESPETIQQRVQKDGLLKQREIQELNSIANPFVLTPHRPNYFLPITYTDNPNGRDFVVHDESDGALDNVEFKFQLSVKFPVAYDVVGRGSSLWFAYTQQAFWQAYNSEISAPFRDTSHEPEAFIVDRLHGDFLGIKPTYIAYGINHQSNGQSELMSRSWNRLFVNVVFEYEHLAVSIKPWYRIHESEDEDDNPNIERYLGYGEVTAVFIDQDISYDLMLRNNLRSDNKGAIQLGVNFPLWGKTRGYVQYFDGYGQSLLDYNNHIRSLGFGIMLTNWL